MAAYVIADNIISPLGFTSEENFEHLLKMETGVKCWEHSTLSNDPVCAALIDSTRLESEFKKLNPSKSYTRLEQLFILSIKNSLTQCPEADITSPRTLIILSSTKGNIDLLDKANAKNYDKKRLFLWETGNIISEYFKNPNNPLIISNACISGVLAIIMGKRLLESGKYDTIIVSGADVMTRFVVSGFQSFKAVSDEVCKPYDSSRNGISLGEACGTMILTNKAGLAGPSAIKISGGASSNDANHISGPSRTGDGLLMAIEKTLNEAKIKPSEIDFISGHGTATLFNDEMESLAINDAHLQNAPINSLKSYFGHTLGAAGIIEAVVGIHSMKSNTLIGTYNFRESGVSKTINVIKETRKAKVDNCLKTAAGFGGCNAAVLFEKN
jgi:3-oxoacyl-[acyl-carrier-protein] synthase I